MARPASRLPHGDDPPAAVLEALDHLAEAGVTANFYQLTTLWPFPVKRTAEVLQKAKRTLLVEANFTGQLGGLIREQTGIAIRDRFLKYDGRPIYPEEVYHKVLELTRG